MTVTMNERDRVIAALTAYGEARNQPRLGRAAVIWTILHRAANPRWWGRDVAGVCLAKWQYSCWNANDPNRRVLLGFLREQDTEAAALNGAGLGDATLRALLAIVDQVCDGEIADPTRGATHYFNPQILAAPPSWSIGRRPSATIGQHAFYAGIEPGVRPASIAARPAIVAAPSQTETPAAFQPALLRGLARRFTQLWR